MDMLERQLRTMAAALGFDPEVVGPRAQGVREIAAVLTSDNQVELTVDGVMIARRKWHPAPRPFTLDELTEHYLRSRAFQRTR